MKSICFDTGERDRDRFYILKILLDVLYYQFNSLSSIKKWIGDF